MELKPSAMYSYYRKLDEFSSKFPLLSFKDVNLSELAKHWAVPPLELLATVVFMDAIHTMNRKGEQNYYIDLEQVKKINVKRKGKKWDFIIHSKEKKQMKIRHVYETTESK